VPLKATEDLMAVHCDVCGRQLYDATENFGSAPTYTGFVAYASGQAAPKQPRWINSTCESCHGVILLAVAEAVDIIRNPPAIACEECERVRTHAPTCSVFRDYVKKRFARPAKD